MAQTGIAVSIIVYLLGMVAIGIFSEIKMRAPQRAFIWEAEAWALGLRQ